MSNCKACVNSGRNVKIGNCGYCNADLCEECCRPDCDWSEDNEDLCCMYCWLEDEAEGVQLADLVAKHRTPPVRPAPKKYILKLKGGKVISRTEIN